jgi:hypothetical protein
VLIAAISTAPPDRLPAPRAAAALGPGAHRIEFVIESDQGEVAPVRAPSTFIVPR